MKRILPILIVISLLLSYVHAETISFPDLAQSHWAYNAVMTLVADGTIRGFEDGEFKPDNTVSRAEFVKMIGKGSVVRGTAFADVDSSHWGYDYIMSSGLEGDKQNHFNPDTPITRYDVAQLIWKRAGFVKDIVAPAMVTNQGANRDAIAWVYAYGIMIGDDGLDLRLNDTLTRAEGASLIVRARAINSDSPQINFIDTVKPKLLETVFNSTRLFDGITYDPDKTITNGEMARAAVRLGSEEHDLSYIKYTAVTPFKHEYAKDLYVVGKYCLGEDKVKQDFIDKKATIQDTIAALAYFAVNKSHAPLSFGAKDNYYKEVKNTNSDMENASLTFAYQNGISFYGNGVINPSKEITLRELAAILLQLDGIAGINSSQVVGEKVTEKNTPLQTDLYAYPSNANKFQCILKEIPKSVYETPFVNIKTDNKVDGNPKNDYDFAREYSIIFTSMMQAYINNISDTTKVNLQFTYYPSLVVNNGNGYTMRMRCEIINAPDQILLKDVFHLGDKIDGNMVLKKGTAFYADFSTGQVVSNTQLPFNLVSIDQVLTNGQ